MFRTARLAALVLLLATAPAEAVLPPIQTSDYYVSSHNGDEVVVYSAGGTYLRSFTAAGLDGPRGIVFAPDGRIFVASERTNEVFVFDENEQYLTRFSHFEMQDPTGMALIDDAELHVCSYANDQIVVFDLDGNYQSKYTGVGLDGPNCIAVDRFGHRFVTAGLSSLIIEFDNGDGFVSAFGSSALSRPMGVAVSPGGDTLYVAGATSHNIVLYDRSGLFLGTLAHPDLTGPQGVAFDSRGHLFSTSFYKNQVVEFDPDGSYVQTISSGSLNLPRSVAFRSALPTTSVPLLARGFALHQNAPNPLRDETVFRFEVPVGGEWVSIRVYDARGRLVKELVDGWQPEGVGSVAWDGLDRRGQTAPPGAYFYRLLARGTAETRKLTILD